MNKCIKNAFLASLITGLSLAPAGRMAAAHLTVLHTFGGFFNNDGASAYADLILVADTLYGTTAEGGRNSGTLFKVNTDGTGFTNLFMFGYPAFPSLGESPYGRLLLVGENLYGTASQGGRWNNGTVFKINPDGSAFTVVHDFTGGRDGGYPQAGLILSSNRMYGTTAGGGNLRYGGGAVFAMSTDGTGVTNVYSFLDTNIYAGGFAPYAPVILSGNTLYGTLRFSAEPGHGAVFSVNADGTGFTNLIRFNLVNAGTSPRGGLVISGNTLYGTTTGGTVFAINTDGTGLTILHRFTNTGPSCRLTLSGNTLYGTTQGGGIFGSGTIFAINTDGTGFTNLYNFTAASGFFYHPTNTDGIGPYAGVVLEGNTLYGTTTSGGGFSCGTIFKLVLSNSPPTITCPSPNIFECSVPALPPFVQVSDPDADPLTIVWNLNGTPVQTNSLPGSLGPPPDFPCPLVSYHGPIPPGTNVLEVSVTDSATNLASCSTALIVLDTTPPVINGLSVDPDVLWPPNHKWADVQVSADITDACGATDWKIIGITSNQEDARSEPDWTIMGPHALKLRAERRGSGGDRIYTIFVQAADESGNLSKLATVSVVVPHSPGQRP